MTRSGVLCYCVRDEFILLAHEAMLMFGTTPHFSTVVYSTEPGRRNFALIVWLSPSVYVAHWTTVRCTHSVHDIHSAVLCLLCGPALAMHLNSMFMFII